MENILVSVVIPVYWGESTLSELAVRLTNVRNHWNTDLKGLQLSEVVFVDDGSCDGSDRVLRSLASERSWVRVVTLSRNFGQHPATVAGILQTSGDWVVTLDEDLQHPPEAILELIEMAATNSFDLIYAQPVKAVHGSFVRDKGSRTIKRFVSVLSGNPRVSSFNSFRLIRGSIARAASAISAQETYFDVALSWFTESIGTKQVDLADRRYAEKRKSGYSVKRLISHARRMIVSSQTKWLRLAAFFGVGGMAISIVLGVLKVTQWVTGVGFVDVQGWASLFVAILFFGGLCALLTGIVLEYMSIILSKALGKPTYFSVDRSSDQALADLIAAYRTSRASHATSDLD